MGSERKGVRRIGSQRPIPVRKVSGRGSSFRCCIEATYFLRGGTITVTTKDVFVVSPPASVTDRVMTDVPALFCTGSIIRVRLDPLPPRLSPVGGMRDGLEDVTLTTNEPAAVSKSPIVNAIALFVLR